MKSHIPFTGTMTANGIPILMSDFPSTNGVVHIVADLIPATDLGTDVRQSQSPLLGFIMNEATGRANVFEGNQGAFVNTGVPLIQVSQLYETPEGDSIDSFNVNVPANFPNINGQSNQETIQGELPTSGQPFDSPINVASVSDFTSINQQQEIVSDNQGSVPAIGTPITVDFNDIPIQTSIETSDLLDALNEAVISQQPDFTSDEVLVANTDADFDDLVVTQLDQTIPSLVGQMIPSTSGQPAPSSFDQSVPSIGLYSAPPSTNEQRTDTFSSQASFRSPVELNQAMNTGNDFNAAKKSLISTWENLAKNFNLAMNGEKPKMKMNDGMKVKRNKISDTQTLDSKENISMNPNEQDNFFIITKLEDFDMNKILTNLDEDIRKEIRVIDTSSLASSNALPDIELRNKLSNMLSQQLSLDLDDPSSAQSIEALIDLDPMILMVNSDKTSPEDLLTSKEKMVEQIRDLTEKSQFGVPLVGLPQAEPIAQMKDILGVDMIKLMEKPNMTTNNHLMQLITAQKNINELQEKGHEEMMQKIKQMLRNSKKVDSSLNSIAQNSNHNKGVKKFSVKNSGTSENGQNVGVSLQDVNLGNFTNHLDRNSTRGIQFFVSLADDLEKIRQKTLQLNDAVRVFKNQPNTGVALEETNMRDSLSSVGKPLSSIRTSELINSNPVVAISSEKSIGSTNILLDNKKLPLLSNSIIVDSLSAMKSMLRTNNFTAGRPLAATLSSPSDILVGKLLSETRVPNDAMPLVNSQRTMLKIENDNSPKESMIEIPEEFMIDMDESESSLSSREHEMNVIEFLRSENLTSFADLIEITGLNRDLIRGGEFLEVRTCSIINSFIKPPRST